MEWTQISKLKLQTFNCDLNLKSAWMNYGFCTVSQSEKYLTKVLRKTVSGVKEIKRGH